MSILINTFLQMNSFIYCLLFAVGACVGSFLNVCIYRIPEGRSVVAPRSHCRSCGKTLAWYDNIPLLGWFLLRGKCRHCGAGFSIRYVFIELITALSFVLLWQQIGGWLAVLGMVFFSVMIIVTMIVLDHLMIPDRFTLGGMFLGVFPAFCLPELHGFESEGIFIVAGVRSMIMASIGVVVGAGILIWIAVMSLLPIRIKNYSRIF